MYWENIKIIIHCQGYCIHSLIIFFFIFFLCSKFKKKKWQKKRNTRFCPPLILSFTNIYLKIEINTYTFLFFKVVSVNDNTCLLEFHLNTSCILQSVGKWWLLCNIFKLTIRNASLKHCKMVGFKIFLRNKFHAKESYLCSKNQMHMFYELRQPILANL